MVDRMNLTDCQVRKLALRTIDGYKKTASSADAMAGGQ